MRAATHLFARRGYAGTSVREIVERAGVTKPVLYYHFGSKEGIYRALAEELLTEFELLLSGTREHRGTVRARITALCQDVLALAVQRLETVRFFYSVFYGPAQGVPSFDVGLFLRLFRAALAEAVAAGVERGEIDERRSRDLADAIEAVLNFAIEAILTEPERRFSAAELTRLIDLLFSGAGARSQRAGRPATRPTILSQETRR